MSQKASQSPRSKRNRLERIDIDELFDSPSNRGMLSFLERAPEEALARLEERRKVDSAEAARTSLPRLVDTLIQSLKSPGEVTTEVDPVQETPRLVGSLTENHEFSLECKPELGELAKISSHASPSEIAALSPVCALHPVGDFPSVGKPTTAPELTTEPRNSELRSNAALIMAYADVIEPSTGDASPPVGDLPPVCGLLAEGDLPPLGFRNIARSEKTAEYNSFVPRSSARSVHDEPETGSDNSTARPNKLPTEGKSPPASFLPSSYTPSFRREISVSQTSALDGVSDPTALAHAGGKLTPDVVDGTIIGRRQKIRRAIVAQDGHSSGEQLLYQTLWNAARPESGSLDRRMIVAGYQGMSALCKLDKKNCKKNAKGLIDKLAIEVAETYRSDERIGTTYRIFSYKEILRRREEAGMVWVVRTSGVRFVDLAVKGNYATQGMTHPVGNLPTRLEALRVNSGGNSPTHWPRNSPTDPGGNWPRESVGNSPRGTVGEAPTPLRKERNSSQEASPTFPKHLGPKLRSVLPSFDDDAVQQLWARCSQIAPDCTDDDIEYCFRIKANQLLRGRKKIDNPVGIMIWSVPKTFEGADPLYMRRRLEIERIRTAEEEERQRSRATLMEMLEDSRTSPEDKTTIQRLLEEMGD